MKLAFVLLIFSLVGASLASSNIVPFIVGGGQVPIFRLPYQASVLQYGNHICGGSIIALRFILTSAHCTHDLPVFTVTVRVGSDNWASGGQELPLKGIWEHHQYDPLVLDFDFSIIELADFITHPMAEPIDLPFAGEQLNVDTNIMVSGWGSLYPGGPFSPDLYVVEVPVVKTTDCRDVYEALPNAPNKITDQMFCAGIRDIGGKDACKGDDGGPAAFGGKLYGVISFRYECGDPKYPGVYAMVSSVRDWIHDIAYV